jgi:hypothetical protein
MVSSDKGWTAESVAVALVEGFRALPSVPVYIAAGDELPKDDPNFIAALESIAQFCPPGYVSLGMATLLQFGVECEAITTEWEEEKRGFPHADFSQGKPRVQMLFPFDLTADEYSWNWICIRVSDESGPRITRLVPPLVTIIGDTWLPISARDTVLAFRREFSSGRLSASVIEADGLITQIPAHYWNSDTALQTLWCDTPAEFRVKSRKVSGQVIITRQSLLGVLAYAQDAISAKMIPAGKSSYRASQRDAVERALRALWANTSPIGSVKTITAHINVWLKEQSAGQVSEDTVSRVLRSRPPT